MLAISVSFVSFSYTVGGFLTYAFQGCVESLFWGWGTGAWLALCSLAMSDMTSQVQPHGELGVKGAWGEQLRF